MSRFPDHAVSALERVVPELMHEVAIPGLSICLVKEGALFWSHGFGMKETGRDAPVDTATIFEAASLSKPLFAYGVMRLQHEGLLDLDTPLTRYMPGHEFCADPRLDRVTARTVLSHTTGWPNWRRQGRPLRFKRAPGKAFGYSGEGYVYLQQVVEHISGQSLNAFMQQAVLRPLGMTRSSYVWRESYESDAAIGHKGDGSPYPRERPVAANAAASLFTTPEDFARFLTEILALQDHHCRATGVDIDAMLVAQVSVAGALSWSLGWGFQRETDDEIVWQWGDNPGFKNFVAAKRRARTGLIVMTNGDNGTKTWASFARLGLGLGTEIFDWLAATFYGPESLASSL